MRPGGQRVPGVLGLKERAQPLSASPGPGARPEKHPGASHWLNARLACATQNAELSSGFIAKMGKCGINLPCSMA